MASDLEMQLSGVQAVLESAGIAELGWLQVIDGNEAVLFASQNALGEIPDTARRMPWRTPTPTAAAIILSLEGSAALDLAQHWLCSYYPIDHQILIVPAKGNSIRATLADLCRAAAGAGCISVYLPPVDEIDDVRTISGIMNLVRTLRAPDGCPWDREQTHASLKPHLLEETYEVLEALDSGDPTLLSEEMGDLFYQIALHCQVSAEQGSFTLEDVIQNIVVKLIGRHPHVFADLQLDSAQDVRHAWESFKQREKPERVSILEQIPHALPALPQSNLVQKRAASVGFEWSSPAAVIGKVKEELSELIHAIEGNEKNELKREELGDLFFSLVSLARYLHIDPEEALRLANRKFERRFRRLESAAAQDSTTVRDLPKERLTAIWEQSAEPSKKSK